jgi:hypothetical protein
MAALIIDEGLAQRQATIYGNSIARTPDSLRLYTAISPALSKASVLANFTQLTAIMGYVAKTVAGADWSFAIDTTNHWCIATASYAWTFTAGAGFTVLGWYMLSAAGGKVMMAEEFPAPFICPAGGGNLTLTINDKYKDCV